MYNKISSQYICPYDKNNLIANLSNIKQTLVSEKNILSMLAQNLSNNLSKYVKIKEYKDLINNFVNNL